MADWWDDWKISLRKVLLATANTARQGLTKSYLQRMHCLYIRLNTAPLVSRTPDTSPSGNHEGCDQPSTPDTPVNLSRKVAEYRRLWQRTTKEHLLVQHTYTPGDTYRRFYVQVATKFQDNTIVSLGGKASSGPNRSEAFSDEMADGYESIIIHFFACPDNTSAFLSRAIPTKWVDNSTVTLDISPDDVR